VPTKALHLKPKVFFTSSQNSREDLLVKTLHFIPLVKRSACAAREVFSLARVRMVFLIKSAPTVLKRRRCRLVFCTAMAERRRKSSLHAATAALHSKGAAFSSHLHKKTRSLACEDVSFR